MTMGILKERGSKLVLCLQIDFPGGRVDLTTEHGFDNFSKTAKKQYFWRKTDG